MLHALIAVSDSAFPNLDPARKILAKCDAELRLAEEPTPKAILKVARDADAVLVTYAQVTDEMIRQMMRCRIIARFGVGVDNVDIGAATEAGILVTNVPDYCVDEVSDHAMALLLALARKVPFANTRAHAGRWEMPAVVPIHRLRGSILGLLGFGRISQLLTPKAKAFGLKVISCDPLVERQTMTSAGVEKVDFAELIRISDYISIHAPLVPETDRLFDGRVFRQMQPSAYLINTARGSIVDEAALAHALDAGQLAGAALDVLSREPPQNSPLLGRENVILTPHMSFYSVESLIDLQTRATEEVLRVLSGERPHNAVNPEALKVRKHRMLIVGK
jgi:D-3-phosphoglycerate dehydrogenase / 2-oxoglutarate reductase